MDERHLNIDHPDDLLPQLWDQDLPVGLVEVAVSNRGRATSRELARQEIVRGKTRNAT